MPASRGLRALLFARAARPLRFALTGAIAGLTQLGLLSVFLAYGTPAVPANALAFLLAAQVNFALSQAFTWRDRPHGLAPGWGLARRWGLFHGSIAATAVVNMAVFTVARRWTPELAASVFGIGVTSVVNFIAHDRLTFRPARRRRIVPEPTDLAER